MTLDELLSRFPTSADASRAAGLSRTAACHWYHSGDKRLLPSIAALLGMADAEGLTDAEIGRLVKDVERIRNRIYLSKLRKKAAKTREEGRLRRALEAERESRKTSEARLERAQQSVRGDELREKEEFLESEENGAKTLERMIRILEGD